MAKCRIGHFVERRILQSLGVDYIDESEVLTPADEEFHVDKFAYPRCRSSAAGRKTWARPCGIGEGARDDPQPKGEAGTGNIVEAVRHIAESVISGIRRLTNWPGRDDDRGQEISGRLTSWRAWLPPPEAAGPELRQRVHRDPRPTRR